MLQIQYRSFSELGKRKNNEDYCYPSPGNTTEKTDHFIVCDGVGGNDYGEMASQLSTVYLHDFIKEYKGSIDGDFINEAIRYVQDKLDGFLQGHPEVQNMATTLTMAYFFDGKCIVAHVGDSRIYQFRGSRILYKSRDHSLVNELIQSGNLSEEDAENHKQKNIITRAVQPASVSLSSADTEILDDIAKGDHFLLCTDGVLESAKEKMLMEVFGNTSISMDEKMAYIQDICRNNSKDNATACIIEIMAADKEGPKESIAGQVTNTAAAAYEPANDEVQQPVPQQPIPQKPIPAATKPAPAKKLAYVFVILLFAAIAAYFAVTKLFSPADKNTPLKAQEQAPAAEKPKKNIVKNDSDTRQAKETTHIVQPVQPPIANGIDTAKLVDLATKGDTAAMIQLFKLYEALHNQKADEMAVHWYKLAIAANVTNPGLKGDFGILLYEGRGKLKKDTAEAKALMLESYKATKNAVLLHFLSKHKINAVTDTTKNNQAKEGELVD